MPVRELHLHVAACHREDPNVYVAVRNCGADVAVGDTVRPRGAESPTTALQVASIVIYGRYSTVLNAGLTGELELRGPGVPQVVSPCELVGVESRSLPESRLLGAGADRIRPRTQRDVP